MQTFSVFDQISENHGSDALTNIINHERPQNAKKGIKGKGYVISRGEHFFFTTATPRSFSTPQIWLVNMRDTSKKTRTSFESDGPCDWAGLS